MRQRIRIAAIIMAVAAATVSARANSITVTQVNAVNGGGGSQWTYDLSFVNSTLNNGDFVTINDFGSGSPLALPAGWAFSQSLVGPNSLPAFDNPGRLNATLTWVGGNGVVISPNASTIVDETITLASTGFVPSTQVLSDYTTIDQVSNGDVAGTDSRVIGSVQTPGTPRVPDGGSALGLMGLALVGVELLRRFTAPLQSA